MGVEVDYPSITYIVRNCIACSLVDIASDKKEFLEHGRRITIPAQNGCIWSGAAEIPVSGIPSRPQYVACQVSCDNRNDTS